MKRALIGFFSIILVLIAVVAVLPSFFDWNQYKGQATSLIKAHTGLDADLKGDLKIAIFPAPYAYVNNVVIESPLSDHYDTLASLERLDLNLAFMPLLSGKVVLTSVNLVKPDIGIEALADGSQSWQTAEIKAMMEGSKDQADASSAVQSGASAMDSVALNNVKIDGGRLRYYDHKTKSETIIDNLGVKINADTLSGPFMAEGSFDLAGRNFAFDGKSGKLTPDTDVIPLDITANIKPDNIDVKYSGVVSKSGALDLQGNTQVRLADISAYGGSALKSNEASIAGILTLKDGAFALQDMVAKIGASDVTGAVKGKISPIEIDLDLKAADLEMNRLTSVAGLEAITSAAIKGKVAANGEAFGLKDADIAVNDSTLSGDILYNAGGDNTRPALTLKARSSRLDLGMLKSNEGNGSAGASSPADIKKTLEGFSLPLDITFDVDVAEGRYDAYAFSGLKAKGALVNNTLKLDAFNVASFADAAIRAQGHIADIKNLGGLDVTFGVKSANFKPLAQMMKMDISSLPADLGSTDIAVQAKGTGQGMDVTTNIKAMNGEVIASGKVADPLGALAISGLALQVKHRNMNEALNIISPGSGNYSSFNKPMDFYALVEKDAGGYQLNSIKADMAGIPVQGAISLDLDGQRPYMKGDLTMGDVVVVSAGGQKSATPPASSAPGATRWSREALNNAWMQSFDYDFNIKAKSINYEGWNLNAPVIVSSLKSGTLSLESLEGKLYDGTIALTGTLKPLGKDGGYTMNGDAKLARVSLEPLVASLAGNRILQGKGLIDLDADIATSGISPAALIYGLSGQGTTNGESIVLEGFDLVRFARAMSDETKPGDTVLGVWKSSTKGGSTEFDTMDGSFQINEGIVHITKLDLDGPRAFLNTKGNIDLPKFYITTEHTITLKEEEVPPFPIKISGPLDNPTQTFGQGVLNDYLSRKVGRKLEGLLGDKLGIPGLGGQQQPAPAPVPAATPDQPVQVDPNAAPTEQAPAPAPQQEPQKIKPEDAVKGLLKGLLQ